MAKSVMQRALFKLIGQLAIAALCLVASLGASDGASARPGPEWPKPSCNHAFRLCGYVDRNGAEVIPPRFEQAHPFRDGRAAVKIDGSFGYIDSNGTLVISPKFDLAGSFYAGLAEVLVGQKAGVIDRQGNWVVRPIFSRAIAFTREILLVAEGKWRSGYMKGRQRLLSIADKAFLAFSGAGPWGLYHISGRWIRKPDLTGLSVFEDEGRGLIWAERLSSHDGKVGLMRADGTWAIEPRFDHVQGLSDGRAVVSFEETLPAAPDRPRYRQSRSRWGAVDQKGDIVIAPKYDWLRHFRNGWAIAKLDGKSGLIDKSGSTVLELIYDEVELYDLERLGPEDVAEARLDGEWVGIDRSGKIVARPGEGNVLKACPSGLKLVRRKGRYQFVGADGHPTTHVLFDRADPFFDCDRPSSVTLDGKLSFVGPDGRLLVDPPAFEDVYGFQYGVAAVQQSGKWGLIDARGRFVVEPAFDEIAPGPAGHFRVVTGGRRFWIDRTGRESAPPPELTEQPKKLACGHGITIVEKNGRWGMTDSTGYFVIPPHFDALACFRNGLAWAAFPDRQQWCLIDRRGQISTHYECQCHQPLITHQQRPLTQKSSDSDCYEEGLNRIRGRGRYGWNP